MKNGCICSELVVCRSLSPANECCQVRRPPAGTRLVLARAQQVVAGRWKSKLRPHSHLQPVGLEEEHVENVDVAQAGCGVDRLVGRGHGRCRDAQDLGLPEPLVRHDARQQQGIGRGVVQIGACAPPGLLGKY